jgi:hypothetical protein
MIVYVSLQQRTFFAGVAAATCSTRASLRQQQCTVHDCAQWAILHTDPVKMMQPVNHRKVLQASQHLCNRS